MQEWGPSSACPSEHVAPRRADGDGEERFLRKSVGQTGVGVALIALGLVVTLRVDFHL